MERNRELFAAKKGIKDKQKDGNLVYDEEKGEWVPRWGYKGKNKDGEGDWIVEVDEKKQKTKTEDVDPRSLSREERKERIKKNERQMKKNEKRSATGAKPWAPKKGSGVGKRR